MTDRLKLMSFDMIIISLYKVPCNYFGYDIYETNALLLTASPEAQENIGG